MESPHLTYQMAAEYLGVAVSTLQSWVCRKQIPHLRLGRRMVRFQKAALDAWLRERAVPAKGR